MKPVIENVIVKGFFNICGIYLLEKGTLSTWDLKLRRMTVIFEGFDRKVRRGSDASTNKFLLFFIIDSHDGVAFSRDVSLFIDTVKVSAVLRENRLVENIIERIKPKIRTIDIFRDVSGERQEWLAEIVHSSCDRFGCDKLFTII